MQERLLGATLGCALTGIVVFEQRKRIYDSVSNYQSEVFFFQFPSDICSYQTLEKASSISKLFHILFFLLFVVFLNFRGFFWITCVINYILNERK